MDRERVQRLRDGLPSRLNAGILMGDGGFCILGWALFSVGFHPIAVYGNTLAVVDPARGGPVIDVVAHEYGLDRRQVLSLARANDNAPSDTRVAAVRAVLDTILAGETSS